MDENETLGESLDAEASAYFESKGETITPKEPEKTPEPAVKPEPEDEAAKAAIEGRQSTQVPLKALQEEREEKKALRAELAEMQRKQAILDDRWKSILAMGQQPEPAPKDEDPEPDRNADIFAHNAWLARQLDGLKKGIGEREANEKQAKEAQEYEGKVWQFWNNDAATYKASNPEFEDAVKWMSDTRSGQLKALSGLHPQFRTEAGIVAQINRELFEINVAAAQNNVSPAAYIFQMAKDWGFKGKAPVEDPTKVIADVNKNADAEISLSNMGGGATPGPKTPEDVANMSSADFEAWLSKNGNKGFKRLMGGA